MPASRPKPAFRLQVRVLHDEGRALGPGKADLLAQIHETGSISAAARAMAMSYKRAWDLVDEMNRIFGGPVVAANRGGERGGGARLTPVGEALLDAFRRIEARCAEAAAGELRRLQRLSR